MADTNPNYSSLKIVWHKKKLESLLKNEITAPITVRVKPTNKCNHNCFYCGYQKDKEQILSETFRKKDEIPREKMMEILDDFNDIGVKAVTYSGGGEPLIYPYILEAMKKTIGFGIDLSIITNGQELNDEKAEILAQSEWVRISIDACNAETFNRIRKKPQKWFYEIRDNIKNFSKIKKQDCELGINFVVNHLNASSVYEATKYFKQLGINHIKFTPRWLQTNFHAYHQPFKQSVIEQISQARELEEANFQVYDTYENDFKFAGVKERSYQRCFFMEITPVIGADCNIYDCHDRAYTLDGKIGSIQDKSFKQVWFSEKTANRFKSFNPIERCKHHCTYDARNLLVENILKCSKSKNYP
ncbi:radical SAM protein [Candidatus Pacearchaeota archaeon]|nr:radical SAM protein [Candidatus Pacearchaeota archaeon]